MSRKGFTLVEALIAVAILGIILAGILPSFISYSRLNTDSEFRTSAVAVAQEVMEDLRQLRLARWPETQVVWSRNMGGRDFEVLIEHEPWEDSSNAREVQLQVTHDDRVLYEVETVYTQFN